MKMLLFSSSILHHLLLLGQFAVAINGQEARIRGANNNNNNYKQRQQPQTFPYHSLIEHQEDETRLLEEGEEGGSYFNRVSTFFVCSQLHPTCDVDTVTSAENMAATDDGMKVIYTDGFLGAFGAIDISDPHNPVGLGYIKVEGSPTSIASCQNKAIAVIDTSNGDYLNPSGTFHIIDMNTLEVLRAGELGGQPDSVKMSKDCTRAVVAIENARNKDLDEFPQYPAGFVVVMDISSDEPADWSLHNVSVTGLGNGIYEDMDPEPEFVSINEDNIAVVTLQENNGLVLIDANTYQVLDAFSAGSVTLDGVDTTKDGVVLPTDTVHSPREPDGVVWIDENHFATANEGDLFGGGRGFTIWTKEGDIVYSSGNKMELVAQRMGHYPEARSSRKGNEPENVGFGVFGDEELLFVSSERTSLLFVYDIKDRHQPVLKQVLPAGFEPEGGLLVIPSRGLYLIASETEDREENIRGSISLYLRDSDEPEYPFLVSADRQSGVPIPWGALSSLTTGKCQEEDEVRLLNLECDEEKYFYAADDDFYKKNRIFKIDSTQKPAVIVDEIFISDMDGVLRDALLDNRDIAFDEDSIDNVIDPVDQRVNLDVEGMDTSVRGGFWIVHEGPAKKNPHPPELLLYVDATGVIQEVIPLPEGLNVGQKPRDGLAGVAEDPLANFVVVAFHSPMQDEEYPPLGIWDRTAQEWTFVYYPVDAPESQFAEGSRVMVGDLSWTGELGQFLVVEHDNRAGPDAAVKRIYQIDLTRFDSALDLVQKTLAFDILPDLRSATNGPIVEKVAGLTIARDGGVWVLNDNDGVKDNNGETVLIQVGTLPSALKA